MQGITRTYIYRMGTIKGILLATLLTKAGKNHRTTTKWTTLNPGQINDKYNTDEEREENQTDS